MDRTTYQIQEGYGGLVCLTKTAGGWNLTQVSIWNVGAITKLLWDLAHKPDKLWVRWVHAYYTKKKDLWSFTWNFRRILKCRTVIDDIEGWDNCMHKDKFSIRKLYAKLRTQGEKVSWRRITCNNSASPRSIFITWLALLNRLYTKDRMLLWHLPCSPDCSLCGQEDESVAHLFSNAESLIRSDRDVYV